MLQEEKSKIMNLDEILRAMTTVRSSWIYYDEGWLLKLFDVIVERKHHTVQIEVIGGRGPEDD